MAREELVATFGLNDLPFLRSLRRVERASEKSVKQIETASIASARREEAARTASMNRMGNAFTSFSRRAIGAMVGVSSMTQLASRSVREYAKQSDMAAASVNRLESAQKRMLSRIGKEFSQSGATDMISSSLDFIGRSYTGAVNSTAGFFGADTAGLNQAAAFDEFVTSRMRQAETVAGLKAQYALDAAVSSGDEAGAERMRGKKAADDAAQQAKGQGMDGDAVAWIRSKTMEPFEARAKEIEQKKADEAAEQEAKQAALARSRGDLEQEFGLARDIQGATLAGDSEMAAYYEIERRFQQRMAQAREMEDPASRDLEMAIAGVERGTAIGEVERSEREKVEQSREAARLAQEELGFNIRALEIDTLRASGKERQADEAAAILEYERRLADLARDENLTDADRVRFEAAAAAARDATIGGLKSVTEARTSSLEIGLGSRIQGQVLGTEPKTAVDELRKQTKVLERIADQGVPAVLG